MSIDVPGPRDRLPIHLVVREDEIKEIGDFHLIEPNPRCGAGCDLSLPNA